MSMSKRDYEIIGNILRSNYNAAKDNEPWLTLLDGMTDSMADAFQRDNVRFRKDLFLDAATPDWHREKRGLPPKKRTVVRVHAQRPRPEGF